jgi:uncharacterized protein YbaR (Trm112 family)
MKTGRTDIKIADVLPCPACRTNLTGIRATPDGGLPQAGDLTVCEHCATVLAFATDAGGALVLRLAPAEVMDDPDVAAAAVGVATAIQEMVAVRQFGLRDAALSPCPFCDKDIIVGVNTHGIPVMLHKSPMCRQFNDMGAFEILEALAKWRRSMQRQVH